MSLPRYKHIYTHQSYKHTYTVATELVKIPVLDELTKAQTCILTSCDYVELVNILDELTKLKSYTFTSYDNAEQVNILEMYKHNELLNIWMSTFHEPDWGKKKFFY
jgi:hypothetical protein